MGSIQYPRNFFKFILERRENFTQPGIQHFQVVLSAICIGVSPKNIRTRNPTRKVASSFFKHSSFYR